MTLEDMTATLDALLPGDSVTYQPEDLASLTDDDRIALGAYADALELETLATNITDDTGVVQSTGNRITFTKPADVV